MRREYLTYLLCIAHNASMNHSFRKYLQLHSNTRYPWNWWGTIAGYYSQTVSEMARLDLKNQFHVRLEEPADAS